MHKSIELPVPPHGEVEKAVWVKALDYIHKNLPDLDAVEYITGRAFYIPCSKKLKNAMLSAAKEAVGEREDVAIKCAVYNYMEELPRMFADRLCDLLQNRHELPFRAFWDATNYRLFIIAIHPDERDWEGWEVVSRGMRYDRMFLTELHTVVIRKAKVELHLEQQYIEIGNTFVLAWVVVHRQHA